MMEESLRFSGPAKLLIIERSLYFKSRKKYREGDKKILTKIILNSRGDPVSELNESGSLEYIYNEIQAPVLIRKRDTNGRIIEETAFIYKDGKLVEKDIQQSDGTVREKTTFQYNKRGLLVREICGSRITVYQYETGNLCNKEYRYYGNDPELVVLYSRDKKGDILSARTYDSRGQLIRTESFSRENGLRTRWRIIRGDGMILQDFVYEHSCFHEGNWLKRICFNKSDDGDDQPVEVIYRSIAYSDSCPEVKPLYKKADSQPVEENGTLRFSDGSTYRGDIINGKMEGKGYINWVDGSSYKGEFKNNMMDGHGILIWPNGDIYSGSFCRGKMDGIGRLRWTDGRTFYGLFKEGRRTSQGIIEEDDEY